MKIPIVKIGTSKGIRIPASILKELDKPQNLDISLVDGKIILDPIKEARQGWDKKFSKMSEDELLIDDNLDLEELNNEL